MTPPPYTVELLSRNVLTVRIDVENVDWHQDFLLRSDVHHDHPKCDQELETKHLDEAVERNAGVIDAGDCFCAMQGKSDRRSSKSALREEHKRKDYLDALVETAGKFYAPYAQNILVFGEGNHESAVKDKLETDLTTRLVERLNVGLELRQHPHRVQRGGYGGWVRFLFTVHKTKRFQKVLHYFHGTGGGGPVTRGVIQTNRMAVFNPDADVILTGHTHDEWIVPIARHRINTAGTVYHDEQLHVRTPGYKDEWGDGYGGWSVEKMLGPKPKGAAWLRFTCEDNAIRTEVTRAK